MDAMTRVFIVSGIRLYGEGLAQMVSRDGRLRVTGVAATLDALPSAVSDDRADVILLDLAVDGALEALRRLAQQPGAPKAVALGLTGDASQILACAEAGIAGYVCRDSSLDDLVRAIAGAVCGELDCSPHIAGALMWRIGRLAARPPAQDGIFLTPRQTQVARLLERGLTNQEIGEQLHIEVSTVKIHLHNIFEKLGVHYRGQAVAKMRGMGLLPPN